MKVLPFSTESLDEALHILREGGVVAHATETCYGFACDLKNPKAVRKLFAIKQRPESQPISALFETVDAAKNYAEWNEQAEELSGKLPGPLTLIVKLKPNSGLYPTPAGGATVGIRVSSHAQAESLVKTFGSPLSTTSANLHGQPNPYSAGDIRKQFEHQDHKPDLILDSGVLPPTPPSTVIDTTGAKLEEKRSGDLRI